MNIIMLINVTLHGLLLSSLGWFLVSWCVSDARHRAWTALLVLLGSICAPLLMEFHEEPSGRIMEVPAAVPVAAWKPDWKVPAATVVRADVVPRMAKVLPGRAAWAHAGGRR